LNKTKQLVYGGLCLALCVVLPLTFHSVANAGSIFLPMHIPVLACGLLCGWPYGLACGILGPVLSSVMTGMPPAGILPSMMLELAVYGLVSGLLSNAFRSKNSVLSIYLPLVCAMLAGRVASGIANALIFQAGSYSLKAWLTVSFATALPGILIQLLLIPAVILTLRKTKLAPMGA